jgi:hypothetical protein
MPVGAIVTDAFGTGAGVAGFKLRSTTSSGFELGAWLTARVVWSSRIETNGRKIETNGPEIETKSASSRNKFGKSETICFGFDNFRPKNRNLAPPFSV